VRQFGPCFESGKRGAGRSATGAGERRYHGYIAIPSEREQQRVTESIRVLTYNIRKGKGASGRATIDMGAMGEAMRAHPIDLVLCQEVFHCARTGASQSGHLAEALGFDSYYGANKFREMGHHGNTTLTRLRVQHFENHDISTNRVERRGALYVRCTSSTCTSA
jgi:endonuclease/exonuclease/phosphatase family metal-dependent hydrolase